MTPEYQVALIRGLITAVLTFLAGMLAALATDASTGDALIAGGIPAVAVLLARFGGEGTIDSNRAHGGGLTGLLGLFVVLALSLVFLL